MNQYSASTSGLRVKQCRLMASCTRKQFEERFGINVNTIQAWESNKSPLTLKGATKIVHALDQAGISCHIEWLLYGKGNPPEFITSSQIISSEKTNSDFTHVTQWNDELAILKEIEIFSKHNPNPSLLVILDDAMEPFYSIGDYVGGRKRTLPHYNDYIGTICIIETEDGISLCRRLEKSQTPDHYHLVSLNPKTTIQHPIIFNVKLKSIAPVIWHRKRDIPNI